MVLEVETTLLQKLGDQEKIIEKINTEPVVEVTGTAEHQPVETESKKHKVKTEILCNLKKFIGLYQGTDPKRRDKLPKIRPNLKTKERIDIINKEMINLLEESDSISKTQCLIYCGALTVIQHMGIKIQKQTLRTERKDPRWKIRLETNIKQIRRKLTKICASDKGNLSAKDVKRILKVKNIKGGDKNYNEKLAVFNPWVVTCEVVA
ncbi:unnamed protein product [Psylliodes chrysocephalus]|uniref:Uncharacterized protein n=1 Tax=Psylliodes chrysocephalus TaxID=3402493 RepID=A0A9P0DAK3_9CUCU|nr:unnamed protein product [Psylliodes chrysocephala]